MGHSISTKSIKCCKTCYDKVEALPMSKPKLAKYMWETYQSGRRNNPPNQKPEKGWGFHFRHSNNDEGKGWSFTARRRMLNLRSPALKRFSRASRRRAGAI